MVREYQPMGPSGFCFYGKTKLACKKNQKLPKIQPKSVGHSKKEFDYRAGFD